MRSLALLLVLGALLAFTTAARAHGGRPASAAFQATGRDTGVLTVTGRTGNLVPSVDGCATTPSPTRGVQSVFEVTCRGPLAGRALRLAGLGENELVILTLNDELEDGRAGEGRVVALSADAPTTFLAGAERATDLIGRFGRLGLSHVLGGLDHVLFLIALAARALGRRGLRAAAFELLSAATLFTAAHALTLGAVTAGVLRIPPEVAEGAIAASLVLVALDLGADRGRPRRDDLALIVLFGLVHGLGFAGGLLDAGLPEGRALVGLVAFNVGVEGGQALVLAASLAAAWALPRRLARPAVVSCAYAVGVAGAFLFLSRTLPLWSS